MQQVTEIYKNIQTFHAKARKDWLKWLERNNQSSEYVWLIVYKKESDIPSVYYVKAVDYALAFGLIDSKL